MRTYSEPFQETETAFISLLSQYIVKAVLLSVTVGDLLLWLTCKLNAVIGTFIPEAT